MPTPVSALLHAATMVTAGIYLLIRFAILIQRFPIILSLILIIGSLTAVFGALLASFQLDVKKIIAFSTLSQLGYMFTAIGLIGFKYSLFHLVTHAAFKALLFLSAGVIIHALNNEQDIRRFGGLAILMPNLYIFMLIGFLALSGFPFLAGFDSKDLIIELSLAFYNRSFFGFFVAFLLNFAAFLTSYYCIRTIYYVFFTKPNFTIYTLQRANKTVSDLNVIQFVALVPLVIGAIIIGKQTKFLLYTQISKKFWHGYIGKSVLLEQFEPIIHHNGTKLIPILCAFVGAFISYQIHFNSKFQNLNSKQFSFVTKYFYKKFYYDYFINRFIVGNFFKIAFYCYYQFDRGLLQNLIENVSKFFTIYLFNLNKDEINRFEHQFRIALFIYISIVVVGFLILIDELI